MIVSLFSSSPSHCIADGRLAIFSYMCSFFFNGFKKMRCYFSIYNNSNVLTEVIPRPVAWCNVHFIHIYNLYILDRHQVWRSHDPTSVRNFPFCEIKKRLHTPFLVCISFVQTPTGYQRLPDITRSSTAGQKIEKSPI